MKLSYRKYESGWRYQGMIERLRSLVAYAPAALAALALARAAVAEGPPHASVTNPSAVSARLAAVPTSATSGPGDIYCASSDGIRHIDLPAKTASMVLPGRLTSRAYLAGPFLAAEVDGQSVILDPRTNTQVKSPLLSSLTAGMRRTFFEVSADGKRLAYLKGQDAHGAAEVFVADIDGKNEKQLTDNGSIKRAVLFSRDGATIYFTSNHALRRNTQTAHDNDNDDLYSVPVAGGPVSPVSTLAAVARPVLTPTGDSIVYWGWRAKGTPDGLYAVALKTGQEAYLGPAEAHQPRVGSTRNAASMLPFVLAGKPGRPLNLYNTETQRWVPVVDEARSVNDAILLPPDHQSIVIGARSKRRLVWKHLNDTRESVLIAASPCETQFDAMYDSMSATSQCFDREGGIRRSCDPEFGKSAELKSYAFTLGSAARYWARATGKPGSPVAGDTWEIWPAADRTRRETRHTKTVCKDTVPANTPVGQLQGLRLSPDGTQLVFVVKGEREWALYVADRDGSSTKIFATDGGVVLVEPRPQD